MSAVTTEWVTPAHGRGLVALFERAESPCLCRWWHFSGDKNAWLDRCANHRDENRRELEAALARGSDEASGVVALASERVVGWMKLAPASAMSKLLEQRLYRALPVFAGERERVFLVGCFLIDPAWRRKGVARALVETGIALARARGARAIEAFPRRAEGVPDEQLWTGPESIFAAAGFVAVHDAPYPVLRYVID